MPAYFNKGHPFLVRRQCLDWALVSGGVYFYSRPAEPPPEPISEDIDMEEVVMGGAMEPRQLASASEIWPVFCLSGGWMPTKMAEGLLKNQWDLDKGPPRGFQFC